MPARIGVVIPMYNSAATVEEAIDSLRAQTFEDWSCVVVNDGSTDDGPAIVERIARQEPRVRMVTQANRGLAGARNRGIDEVRAAGNPFIHFLDADDWMTERGLEWLHAAAQETGASYGGYELRDQHGRSLGRQSPVSAPISGLDEELEWNRAATHARFFAIETLGNERFDERLRVVEDCDLWLRLACNGVRWKGVERIVAGYRLRPGSMSKAFGPMAAQYEAIVRSCWRRAREMGWGERIDLSGTRLRRVLTHTALMYATMDALLDADPGKGRAARLLEASGHQELLTPAQAAQAACTALLFGACTAPAVDGWSERRWLTPLRRWWVRCADEGWLHYERVSDCFAELARKVVHPDEVADRMLEACRGSDVVVLGIEKNGRRLCRRAAARGLRVTAFDAFSSDREVALLDDEDRAAGVRVVRDGETFKSITAALMPDTPWLVAPVGGRELETAVAGRAGHVVRWASERERLGAINHERMRVALEARRAG